MALPLLLADAQTSIPALDLAGHKKLYFTSSRVDKEALGGIINKVQESIAASVKDYARPGEEERIAGGAVQMLQYTLRGFLLGKAPGENISRCDEMMEAILAQRGITPDSAMYESRRSNLSSELLSTSINFAKQLAAESLAKGVGRRA